MAAHWEGTLLFENEIECKCEEKVKFTYSGIVHINDVKGDKKIADIVSINTQENINTTYSIKSTFNVSRVTKCQHCEAVHDSVVKCVLTYTHPITETTKLMVVCMDGLDHQVVSVPIYPSNAE
jgi:hypothetical protein